MRILYTLFLSFLFVFCLFSCSETNTTNPDPNNGSDPTIQNITPNPAVNYGEIVISGTNFDSTRGGSYVDINGIKPSGSEYKSWSDTKIIIYVPGNATSGAVKIVVGNKTSNSFNLTINPDTDTTSPLIISLSQNIAQEGQEIGINGKNFGESQSSSFVKFNGTLANEYNSWSDNKIIVKVPEGAQTGPITVTVKGKESNSKTFTVQSSNKILKMIAIPAGSFVMGNDKDDWDASPAHTVNITRGFLMSETEITQKQWADVMDKSDPSHDFQKGPNYPVNQITWIQACKFCNKLSQMENLTPCYTIVGEVVTCNFDANGYRLPTEAEWEYACRAGTTGDFAGDINKLGWTSNDDLSKISMVKTKDPNAFGLYDMHGNVYEWCWDYYADDYYGKSPATDPRGPADGLHRIMRGGSYMNDPETCSSYIRESQDPTLANFSWGLRVVRVK